MPNWAEGNIRFRGKPENIMNFLTGELKCVATNAEFETISYDPVCEWDQFDDITFKEPEEKKNDKLFWKSLYINGTRRNFIDGIVERYLPRDKQNYILCLDNFKAAWGVDPDPYVEKAKKYGVDIKIVVYECGMCFVQRIEIVNGTLVRNEETKYNESWDWEADFPNMGG